MCRRNHAWGLVLVAFGLGVLVGTWTQNGLFCHLFGLLAIFGGVATFTKK